MYDVLFLSARSRYYRHSSTVAGVMSARKKKDSCLYYSSYRDERVKCCRLSFLSLKKKKGI